MSLSFSIREVSSQFKALHVVPTAPSPENYHLKSNSEAPILWPPDAKSHLIKTLKLRKTEGRRRRGRQRVVRWLDGITNSVA